MSLQIQGNGGSSPILAYADTEPAGVATVSDPATAMLALILQNQRATGDASQESVEHAKQALEDARRQIKDAMQRSADAEQHSGFLNKLSQVFSGDIGALCEIVAAAAVIVGTGGVGAAGVLAITAAALCVSSDIAKHAGASPGVCAVLSGAGALAGLAVGNVGGLSAVGGAMATAADGVGLAANVAGTGATVASQYWHATAEDRQADATTARGQESAAGFDYDLAIDALQHEAHDTSRATSTASDIAQTDNDGRVALISRLGAA